jgi:glucose-6-phosphate 1-epimerase
MNAGQPMCPAESLNQFEIPHALVFEEPRGGLPRARVSTAVAEAFVYLQGAHLTQWTPRGQRPVLFLSEKSLFASGHPIRGGVPIIFPWFGERTDGKAGPAHGFARRMDWSLEETRLCDDGRLVIKLALSSNDTTRALGFDSFRAYFRLAIGEDLEMQLEIHNDGNQKLTYEEACTAISASPTFIKSRFPVSKAPLTSTKLTDFNANCWARTLSVSAGKQIRCT